MRSRAKQTRNGSCWNHATVNGGHANVGQLSNNLFCSFKQLTKILKKVTERSRDRGRRSRDRRTTVKQRFWTFQAIWKNFEKKSLTGHATVVGGHATVCWLSNNVFERFKQSGQILKKVAERSRDSGRRSRDRRPTVKQRFWTFQAIWKKFEKKSLTGHTTVVGGHATVCWLSNNVFERFKQSGQILKKVAERSRDSGWRSRDRLPTVKILKKVA